MHATDPGPVRVRLARYEYADDVLEVWGTVRSAAGAPPEPELPINEGEGRLVSEVDRVCALLHKTKAQLVDMLCFSVYVERHFLAPYKGKNNWDGLTGIKKNMCRRAELHDEVRMHCVTDVLGFFLEADAK